MFSACKALHYSFASDYLCMKEFVDRRSSLECEQIYQVFVDSMSIMIHRYIHFQTDSWMLLHQGVKACDVLLPEKEECQNFLLGTRILFNSRCSRSSTTTNTAVPDGIHINLINELLRKIEYRSPRENIRELKLKDDTVHLIIPWADSAANTAVVSLEVPC